MIHKSSLLLLQLYVTDRETAPSSRGPEPPAVICIRSTFPRHVGERKRSLGYIECDGGGRRVERGGGGGRVSLLIGGQYV